MTEKDHSVDRRKFIAAGTVGIASLLSGCSSIKGLFNGGGSGGKTPTGGTSGTDNDVSGNPELENKLFTSYKQARLKIINAYDHYTQSISSLKNRNRSVGFKHIGEADLLITEAKKIIGKDQPIWSYAEKLNKYSTYDLMKPLNNLYTSIEKLDVGTKAGVLAVRYLQNDEFEEFNNKIGKMEEINNQLKLILPTMSTAEYRSAYSSNFKGDSSTDNSSSTTTTSEN